MSFSLIVSIIINIRCISLYVITLSLYDIYIRTTQIHPGFSHKYTRKVHLPHSKHYYKHPIYFPLCNTDLQVRMISITCALVRLYLGTSSHAKHRSPTTPQIDALTRRRHPRLPLNIHEMSWQRVSRHVRATESHSITLSIKGGNREYTKCHTGNTQPASQYWPKDHRDLAHSAANKISKIKIATHV